METEEHLTEKTLPKASKFLHFQMNTRRGNALAKLINRQLCSPYTRRREE